MKPGAVSIVLALALSLPICAQTRKSALPMTMPIAVAQAVPVMVPSSRPKMLESAKNGFPRTHYDLGMYLKEHGATDAALVEFLKATEDNPNDSKAFFEQALIFRDKNFYKLAESALEQSIAASADVRQNLQAQILLATIRLQQGNLQEALAELSQMIGLNPPKAVPYKMARADKDAEDAETEKLMSTLAVMQMPHGVLPVPQDDIIEKTSTEIHTAFDDAFAREILGSDILRGIPGIDPNVTGTSAAPPTTAKTENPSDTSKALSAVPIHRSHLLGLLNRAGIARQSTTYDHKTVDRLIQEQIARKTKEVESQLQPPQIAEHHGIMAIFSRRSNETAKAETGKSPVAVTKVGDLPPQVRISDAPESNAALSFHDEIVARNTAAVQETQGVREVVRQDGEHKQVTITRNIADAAPNAPARVRKPAKPQPGGMALTYHQACAIAHQSSESQAAPPAKDAWTTRLAYLEREGTASLKEGEAFLYSEETGEATLFLTDGEVITRRIADGHQSDDVALMRRPDVMVPQEFSVDLSLLGKILPKQKDNNQAKAKTDAASNSTNGSGGPIGWLKSAKGALGL